MSPRDGWARPMRRRRLLSATTGLACVTLTCQRGSPPELLDPGDQVAVVGQPLYVSLYATDPDGGPLSFSFSSTLDNAHAYAFVEPTAEGQGAFRYTPVAGHEGRHVFEFVASDGDFEASVPVGVEVHSAHARDRAPVFRQPQAGLVIEAETPCGEVYPLRILVEDLDSVAVEVRQVPPVLENARLTLDPDSQGKEGLWTWCPTPADRQVFAHRLRLRADDGDSPPTHKEVSIVVRSPSDPECPGTPPSISHTPQNATTARALTVSAQVRDDVGVSAPVLYYALEDPTVDGKLDVARLSPAHMTLDIGDGRQGTWRATIPNPALDGAEGAVATLFYALEVVEPDDPERGCSHRVTDPEVGVHAITVGLPKPLEPTALCRPCASDRQCAGAGSRCVQLTDASACLPGCAGDQDCPAHFWCSPHPSPSVDGSVGRLCVPDSGACGAPDCIGDAFDPYDDTPSDAWSAWGALQTDRVETHAICPADVDWRVIDLQKPASLVVALVGESPASIDLTLFDAAFGPLDDVGCLPPGRYYSRVRARDGGSAPPVRAVYQIEFRVDATACQAPSPCCEASYAAGCPFDADTQACVCATDPLCCSDEIGWDPTCILGAQTTCGLSC